jgi:hypothetical protein
MSALVSNDADFVPKEFGFARKKVGFVPDGVHFVPDKEGFASNEAGIVPSEVAVVPGEVGFVPGEVAVVPREAGVVFALRSAVRSLKFRSSRSAAKKLGTRRLPDAQFDPLWVYDPNRFTGRWRCLPRAGCSFWR